MAQSQRQEAATDEQSASFSNKPTITADNGHGTKVKLWTNEGAKGEFQECVGDKS